MSSVRRVRTAFRAVASIGLVIGLTGCAAGGPTTTARSAAASAAPTAGISTVPVPSVEPSTDAGTGAPDAFLLVRRPDGADLQLIEARTGLLDLALPAGTPADHWRRISTAT